MMFAPIDMLITFIVGLGLGALYFGGLWLTVWYVAHSRSPALLTLGSFWTRTVVCLSGFYGVMHSQWERVLMCLLGFVCARSLFVHAVRRSEA